MIYLLILSIWPIINYLKDNLYKLNSFTDVAIITSVTIAASYFLGKLIQKYAKEGIGRYLLSFLVLIAAFFNYGYIVDFMHFLAKSYFKASYVWLLVMGLLGYGAWKISKSVEIQKIAKLLIIVVVALPVLEMGYHYGFRYKGEIATTGASDPDLVFSFKRKPNVYYILADAYARQDTLKEVAGYDNEPFLHILENKGFIVSRNAYSNYHFTGASLSATMNLRYHKYEMDGSLDYGQMQESLKGNNQVRRIFKKNDYKIISIPAHWHQMSGYGYEDKCIQKPTYEVYESYLSQTPLRVIHFKKHYVLFEDIKSVVNIFPNDPKFIFIHLAQIHDSIYDESGNFLGELHPAFSNTEEAQRYVSSIKVINNKLLDLVEYIHNQDKNSVIIIQADHGPTYVGNLTPKNPDYWAGHADDIRLKEKNDFRYTFGIFSAIYLPASKNKDETIRNYFLDKPSLINSFIYLFAYLSEVDPQPLKDEHHFLYFDPKAKVYREDDISLLKN